MWFDKLKWIQNVSKGLLENQEILIDIKNEVWKNLRNRIWVEIKKWKVEDKICEFEKEFNWKSNRWTLKIKPINEKTFTISMSEKTSQGWILSPDDRLYFKIKESLFGIVENESEKEELNKEMMKNQIEANKQEELINEEKRKEDERKEAKRKEDELKEKERAEEEKKQIFLEQEKKVKEEREEKIKKRNESWINLWFDKSKDLIKNKILGEVWNSRYYQDVGWIKKTDFWYTIEIVGESTENFWNYISWDNKQRVSHYAELYFDKNFKTIKNRNWNIFGLNNSISMNKFWNYVEITNVDVGWGGRTNYERACFFYDKNFKLLFDWIASDDTEYEVKDWLIKINLTKHSYYTKTPSSSFTFIQPVLWDSSTWVVFLLEKNHEKAFDDIKPSERNNHSSSRDVESYEILKDGQYLVKLEWWIYYLYQTLNSKWKLLELSDLATLLN